MQGNKQDARFVLVRIFTVPHIYGLMHNYQWNQSVLMTRCEIDLHHQYGIFGSKWQTSFSQNATRARSNEGQLFSQAIMLVFELCYHKHYTWELTWMLQLGFLSKSYFMAYTDTERLEVEVFMLKSSSREEQHLNQFNDVVFLQLHVNGLIQFALFCSFLLSFLAFFTEWLWIVLAVIYHVQDFSIYQCWLKCTFIT